MKSTVFSTLISLTAVFGLVLRADAYGPAGCGHPAVYPTSTNAYPYSPYSSSPYAGAGVSSPASFPAATSPAPSAHLTVLPTTSLADSATSSPSTAAGTIHVIANMEQADAPKTTPKVDPTKTVNANASTKPEASPLAEGLKGLVGTWMAVGRHGDGELSTIELQLDKSGWAKLTVPGADGKPSTITRHVDFEGQELKLTGADGALALGKLVEFNDRQLVLDRADGQITFVRP
jgi:hypothetical protein